MAAIHASTLKQPVLLEDKRICISQIKLKEKKLLIAHMDNFLILRIRCNASQCWFLMVPTCSWYLRDPEIMIGTHNPCVVQKNPLLASKLQTKAKRLLRDGLSGKANS